MSINIGNDNKMNNTNIVEKIENSTINKNNKKNLIKYIINLIKEVFI